MTPPLLCVCVQLLCEEVEERRGKFEALSSGSQRHLFCTVRQDGVVD